MTDFLNLPNVTTLRVNELPDSYVVEARSTEPRLQGCRLFCPLRRNGKKVREINDTPIHGKPVLIRMEVQRGICTECGRTGLYEAFPFVQPGISIHPIHYRRPGICPAATGRRTDCT